MLRWALYEAAVYAGRPAHPDHDYYSDVKYHLDGKLALSRWPASSPAAASTCCERSTPTSIYATP